VLTEQLVSCRGTAAATAGGELKKALLAARVAEGPVLLTGINDEFVSSELE
jgi:hypothetical protein